MRADNWKADRPMPIGNGEEKGEVRLRGPDRGFSCGEWSPTCQSSWNEANPRVGDESRGGTCFPLLELRLRFFVCSSSAKEIVSIAF